MIYFFGSAFGSKGFIRLTSLLCVVETNKQLRNRRSDRFVTIPDFPNIFKLELMKVLKKKKNDPFTAIFVHCGLYTLDWLYK